MKKIELMKFLHAHKILKFNHLNCFREANKQMLEYVMINCFLMSKTKHVNNEQRNKELSPFNDYF